MFILHTFRKCHCYRILQFKNSLFLIFFNTGKNIVGSCSGDSGGPLAVNGVQVGIVSFGNKDCLAGKPSVFTRVTKFTEWLKSNSDIQI